MTLTLNLPPQVEKAYLEETQTKGVSLETLVQDVLLERKLTPAHAELSREEWVREFKTWVRSHTGEGLPLLSDEAISRDFIYRERGL